MRGKDNFSICDDRIHLEQQQGILYLTTFCVSSHTGLQAQHEQSHVVSISSIIHLKMNAHIRLSQKDTVEKNDSLCKER